MKYRRFIKSFCLVVLLASLSYGVGRLYFAMTAGFTLANISSDFPYNPEWKTKDLSSQEKDTLHVSLNQDYYYLGKGCQSYVFLSQDKQYVIKFFKFQRFRPQAWIDWLRFIPFVDHYQVKKIEEKNGRLSNLFLSCKTAFDSLKQETGLIYVHLNQTNDLQQTITIFDKLGIKHVLDLNKYAFIVQSTATMLADSIDKLMASQSVDEAKLLIDRLFLMILSEYYRGYADNDHALMQNTGVIDGFPIHIDVGQLIYNEIMQDPLVFHQELANKMTQLCKWLKPKYPELLDHVNNLLLTQLGADYYLLPPYVYRGNVAKIPHQKND